MNRTELANLIDLGEGQTLEFKRNVSEEIGREMSAFANSAGGVILVGVEDDGTVVELKNSNRLKSEIQNYARNCEPPIQVAITAIDGVIVVKVPPSRDKPHSAKGQFFLREGANAQKMNRNQIREFFFKEGLIYFDAAINTRFTMSKDLHQKKYREFANAAGIPKNIGMNNVLRNIGLLEDEGMTNAGALILCSQASRYLISATVTCALFQGTSKSKILDQKVFDEDIGTNFHNALVYIRSHLNTEYIISSVREERLELPIAALREALINALAHRDYRSPANVQVYIFADRIEFVNPGGLAGGLTINDLGKRSAPRNPLLFGALYRMGLVEHVGSGFKRIKDALQSHGSQELKLDINEQWFTLILQRPQKQPSPKKGIVTPLKTPLKTTLKTPQKILAVIAENPHITYGEIAATIGLSLSAVKRAIQKIKNQGQLKRSGSAKSGYWEIRAGEMTQKTPLETPLQTTLKTPQKILAAVSANPGITYEEIANQLGRSLSSIKRAIQKLKDEGLLTRVGPDKGGKWEIVK